MAYQYVEANSTVCRQLPLRSKWIGALHHKEYGSRSVSRPSFQIEEDGEADRNSFIVDNVDGYEVVVFAKRTPSIGQISDNFGKVPRQSIAYGVEFACFARIAITALRVFVCARMAGEAVESESNMDEHMLRCGSAALRHRVYKSKRVKVVQWVGSPPWINVRKPPHQACVPMDAHGRPLPSGRAGKRCQDLVLVMHDMLRVRECRLFE
ncbi:hypothetical protein KPL74_01560 [Bacillus sp. NP157]|nr:hypothetical protein KPL74_01560 [Bacillus sp. NP157]